MLVETGHSEEVPLGELFLLILMLFTFGVASAFLFPMAHRHSKRLDRTVDQDVLARLLEDMDRLSTRLGQVEEELGFFKELRAPERKDRLSAPPGEGEGSDGE